ncbi:MAG: stage II sporulation protein M [Chitinispirillaceae bacterium]|nr:stage II sporulation protein M [Chitinispirillaceae bacterium]
MRSIDFIKNRQTTWLSLEKNTRQLQNRISRAVNESTLISFMNNYRKTIADLSLAQSLFPGSQLVHELNVLVIKAMSLINSNQRSDLQRISGFFRERLPQLVLGMRTLFLVSCTIFTLAAFAGYGLTMLNSFTANAIVGDEYIYKTLVNIDSGKPFAVYESRFKYAMSSFIMANNIKVAFLAFAFGALYGVGTMVILFSNGLMLGSIAAVFARKGLLFDFTTTVLIHGTLELFAVMVAGAAGLRLGQALFRPGELKRGEAMYQFGREAFQICCVMIPVFVVAGILEGFVTHLGLPRWSRLMVIAGSILLLVLYLWVPAVLYLVRHRDSPGEEQPEVRMKL